MDAVLDNAADLAAEFDSGRLKRINELRRVVAEANSRHPQCGLGRYGWAPDDASLHIRMRVEDSMYIRQSLEAAQALDIRAVADHPANSAKRERRLSSLEVTTAALEHWPAARS